MIKNLHKLNVFYAWRKIAMAIFCMASILTANAQLSGSYTVDSSVATGGTNFKTFAEFVDTINTYGISSSTTLTLVNNETLDTTAIFNAIIGASDTHTITIDGAGKAIVYAGVDSSRSVIDLNGTDYMTIKNLIIRNSGTHTGIRGIWFHNEADSNVIEKNTIEFSNLSDGTTSASSGGAYVAFTNSGTGLSSYGDHGSYNKIDGNLMTTTNGNEEGPYAGIYMTSSSSSNSGSNTIDQNEITNNTINNFHYYGIWVRSTNGTIIKGNDISRDAVTEGNGHSNMYGIFSYYNKSEGRALTIEDNIIHDLPYKGAVEGLENFYGIYSFYDNRYGTNTGVTNISGNTVDGVQTTNELFPFYCRYVMNANFDDNTVKNILQKSTANHISFYAYYCGFNSISRNNFTGYAYDGASTWYGMYIYYPQTTGTLVVEDNIVKDYINVTESRYGRIYGMYIYMMN